MDEKIKRLFELCGYDNDPQSRLLTRLFKHVKWPNLHEISQVGGERDALILGLLNEKSVCSETIDVHNVHRYFKKEARALISKEPILLNGGLCAPEEGVRIAGHQSVFIDVGVTLQEVSIDAQAYICKGAHINHSAIQSFDRCTYVGPNVRISNVGEICGSFISGGENPGSTRERTYMHGDNLNNVIVGAYAGISGGTTMWNHPATGELVYLRDPISEVRHIIESSSSRNAPERKPMTLIGTEASIGAQCLLNCGSVVPHRKVVPSRYELKGGEIFKG